MAGFGEPVAHHNFYGGDSVLRHRSTVAGYVQKHMFGEIFKVGKTIIQYISGHLCSGYSRVYGDQTAIRRPESIR